MHTRPVLSKVLRLFVGAICVMSSASCGSELMRTGRAPVFLIMEKLEGAKGNKSTEFVSSMMSDVLTLVDQQVNGQQVKVPTIFNDVGKATIRVEAKDQSFNLSGLVPATSPIMSVTITRYRVNYRRADGRNTPGVDVPFGFDGGTSATIPVGSSGSVIFDLVRHAQKSEPPLRNLVNGGGVQFISTVAEITFFGHDQNGNEVTLSGLMDVTFADFGDED